MANEQSKTQELYSQVVQKAWESSDFKKQLIANPIETIEGFTGSKISTPNGKKLVVLEEAQTLNRQPNSDETYLIIPESTHELTEQQLETVAGGLTVVIHFDTWDLDLTLGGSSDQKK